MADGAAGMGGDVHILYGLSKDLGVAGWRVGYGDAGFFVCVCGFPVLGL